MQGSLLLQLLILLVVANGTAVVAKKLLGTAFGHPLDGGALFVDGQPIFGPSKTIRGIVVSVLATSICATLMGLGWKVGTLVATFAMVGVPQPHRAVGAGGGQAVPVGAERHTDHRAGVAGERGADRLAGVGVPQPHRVCRRWRWPAGARRG